MPSLFILAHAPLATALKAVAGHAYPELAGTMQAFDVSPADSAESVERQLRSALADRPAEDVLILADVFGATPCNAALRVADGVHTRVVTGVNVPMLWRVLCYRAEPLDALVTRAVGGATQGVMQVAVSRPQNQSIAPGSPHDHDAHHHQQ